jgi:hypothetical protein
MPEYLILLILKGFMSWWVADYVNPFTRETVRKLHHNIEDGDNIVGKPKYEQRNFVMENDTITHNDTTEPMGRVYINDTQYFDNVPEVAWNFYIGGYQPAQKMAQRPQGTRIILRTFCITKKIIVALSETNRIMRGN